VLDNYQEVEAGQLFHELVAQAIAEIPAASVLVAISRRDPPGRVMLGSSRMRTSDLSSGMTSS